MTDRSAVMFSDIQWVLWAGTLGFESSIAARVEAAHAAGYGRISVSPLDVARVKEEGTTPLKLGRHLRDEGLEVALDPVPNWYGKPIAGSPLASITVDEVLRVAEALSAVSLSAIGQLTNEAAIEEIATSFGVLCDRAADLGAQVQLEFMPMLAINDLASAWAVVSGADRTNGGILFDTWHFFRGNPDFSTLEQIPGERILGVQVADASGTVQRSLSEDTFSRLMPGDGSLDLLRVLDTLHRIGALRYVGPEVISPITAAMPPVEAARTGRECIERLIGQVRLNGLSQLP